jgi:hypothetical protein
MQDKAHQGKERQGNKMQDMAEHCKAAQWGGQGTGREIQGKVGQVQFKERKGKAKEVQGRRTVQDM